MDLGNPFPNLWRPGRSHIHTILCFSNIDPFQKHVLIRKGSFRFEIQNISNEGNIHESFGYATEKHKHNKIITRAGYHKKIYIMSFDCNVTYIENRTIIFIRRTPPLTTNLKFECHEMELFLMLRQ